MTFPRWRAYGAAALALGAAFGSMIVVGILPLRWSVLLPPLVGGLLILGRWRRGWLLRLWLALAVFGLTLAGLDLIGRVFLFDLLPARVHDELATQWTLYPWVRAYRSHAQIERTVYGDLAVAVGRSAVKEERFMRFRTDDWGFRNDALPTAPLDGVLLGDSFVMGLGVDEADIFPTRLAAAGFATYNLGMSDSAPPDHYLILREYLDDLPLKPKAVILWFIFSGNDLEDIDLPYYEDRELTEIRPVSLPYQWIARLNSWRTRSPTRQVLYPLFSQWWDGSSESRVIEARLWGQPILLYRASYLLVGRTEESITTHPNYPVFQASVAAVAELASDLCLNIILLPSKEEVYGWAFDPPYTRPAPDTSAMALLLRQQSEVLGVHFWDAYPVLRAAAEVDQTGLLWWRDDTHWSPRGHQVMADWLLELWRGGALACRV